MTILAYIMHSWGGHSAMRNSQAYKVMITKAKTASGTLCQTCWRTTWALVQLVVSRDLVHRVRRCRRLVRVPSATHRFCVAQSYRERPSSVFRRALPPDSDVYGARRTVAYSHFLNLERLCPMQD